MLIVASTPDRAVEITAPAPDMLRAMCNGGGLIEPCEVSIQVDRHVAAGMDGELAKRWVISLCHGGHVTATALDLIQRRDIPADRTDLALLDVLPDRWFRNAWRRAPGGGPIFVDLQMAAWLQAHMIAHQRERLEEEVREQQVIARLLRWNENPAEVLAAVDEEISSLQLMAAGSPDHLKALWPSRLPRPARAIAPFPRLPARREQMEGAVVTV